MGLSIIVGMLGDLHETDAEGAEWLESSLATANELLAKNGLPQHVEPRSLELPAGRASMDGFPYSFIHYLRRAYAYRRQDPSWLASPLSEDEDPTDDPVLEAEGDMLSSHLVCHSDAEGFYLPIDFEEVLFADEETDVVGGMLGSSFRLLDELVLVAPALGISLDAGMLSDEEAARVDDLACEDEGLYREYCSWLALYEAARHSIALKTAIVFS